MVGSGRERVHPRHEPLRVDEMQEVPVPGSFLDLDVHDAGSRARDVIGNRHAVTGCCLQRQRIESDQSTIVRSFSSVRCFCSSDPINVS